MKPFIRWSWVWGPAAAAMAAIFYVSSLPDLWALPRGVPDGLEHIAGYGLLGGLLLRALAGARVSGMKASTAWIAIAISVAYAASDEGHQIFVHGRTAAFTDVLVDSIGATVAIGACWLATEAVRRRRARSGAV